MAQWAKYMENKFNYESKAEQSASRINILTTTYERVTQIGDNSLCAIKKDRNALCAPRKVQRFSASLFQLFCALLATAVSLDSNAVKLQMWKDENTLKSKYVIIIFWAS